MVYLRYQGVFKQAILLLRGPKNGRNLAFDIPGRLCPPPALCYFPVYRLFTDPGVKQLAGQVLAQAPDTVLLNGKILTVDDDFAIAQALAITGERISAVGGTEEIAAMAAGSLGLLAAGLLVVGAF